MHCLVVPPPPGDIVLRLVLIAGVAGLVIMGTAVLNTTTADYSPGPGKLLIKNDLSTNANGVCEGEVMLHYGLKPLQVEGGPTYSVRENDGCTIDIRWGTPNRAGGAQLLTNTVYTNQWVAPYDQAGVEYGTVRLLTPWTRVGACWDGNHLGAVSMEDDGWVPQHVPFVAHQGAICSEHIWQEWIYTGSPSQNADAGVFAIGNSLKCLEWFSVYPVSRFGGCDYLVNAEEVTRTVTDIIISIPAGTMNEVNIV